MNKIHQIIFPMALCLSVGLAGIVSARVRIKPHLYLGGGLGVTLGVKDQDFAVEDDSDQSYVDFNDGGKQRSYFWGRKDPTNDLNAILEEYRKFEKSSKNYKGC